MTPRQPDAFAKALYPEKRPTARTRWRRWRHARLPVAAAIGIVIAAGVITDLPRHDSLAGQLTAGTTLLNEVNNDIAPCAFSLNEAVTIYRQKLEGRLARSDRARIPSLLQDDAAACSFTSDNINNLAGIEEPGSGAGRFLTQVVSLTQTWTTSDALGAIDDFISLDANPHDRAAASDLRLRQRVLATDRRAALTALASANAYLHGTLPKLKMSTVTLPQAPLP
ncbi:MAG TPA: hypothetical protein VG368_05110 [Acidimicrobiales bacterium]|jgi:predicted anti-sigma-YlaC factor YlaD|nr:hypothetical protein [Acidimicrobiales bacterium]